VVEDPGNPSVRDDTRALLNCELKVFVEATRLALGTKKPQQSTTAGAGFNAACIRILMHRVVKFSAHVKVMTRAIAGKKSGSPAAQLGGKGRDEGLKVRLAGRAMIVW
jgi:hypothetical protein